MRRRGFFHFTVSLLFIRIPTKCNCNISEKKNKKVAAQVSESELL